MKLTNMFSHFRYSTNFLLCTCVIELSQSSKTPSKIMSTVASAVPASLPDMTLSTTQNPEQTMFPLPPFDPAIHLNFQPPPARHTFTELGLPVPKGCPDICYTDPFQLFSEEGVRMIRREVFQKSFLDKYMRSWDRAPCAITGHAPVKDVGEPA